MRRWPTLKRIHFAQPYSSGAAIWLTSWITAIAGVESGRSGSSGTGASSTSAWWRRSSAGSFASRHAVRWAKLRVRSGSGTTKTPGMPSKASGTLLATVSSQSGRAPSALASETE